MVYMKGDFMEFEEKATLGWDISNKEDELKRREEQINYLLIKYNLTENPEKIQSTIANLKSENKKLKNKIKELQDIVNPLKFTIEQYQQQNKTQIQHRIATRELLLIFQNNVCALCGDYPNCIDHDHETGLIRGLLCAGCNTSIGNYENRGKNNNAEYEDYLTNPPMKKILSDKNLLIKLIGLYDRS